MNSQPLNSLSQEYFRQASERYGVNFENLTLIGGLENFVYSFQKNNRDYVLRVGHSTHLSFELVQAEIDWLLYLVDGDVPVTQPVPSDSGAYVEKIVINETYLNVVAFEKVEGQHLDFGTPNEWNKDIIRQWGRNVGRMHALTKNYTPRSSFRRYDFEPLMDVERLLSHKGKEIVERITSLFHELEELPKTKDSYGLIHSDLHPGNFLVDSKKKKIVCLLDFDRACYKWFISEIAVALYYPLY
ncbi:MAG: phosphotransferase enzyme family protein, partial [Candidatus Hodarchaeota archaeon]